jgi:hypothetical protein
VIGHRQVEHFLDLVNRHSELSFHQPPTDASACHAYASNT